MVTTRSRRSAQQAQPDTCEPSAQPVIRPDTTMSAPAQQQIQEVPQPVPVVLQPVPVAPQPVQEQVQRPDLEQMRERLNQINVSFNKHQQYIKIFIGAVLLAVFLNISCNTQNSDIRQMQDSLSNFYRDFDVETIKELRPVVKEIFEKVLPLTKTNSSFKDHFKSPDLMDKLRFDYAMSSTGGRIAGIGCSRTFYSTNTFMVLLGLPNKVHGPERVIEPGIQQGDCYKFKGQVGEVFIRLAKKTIVDEVIIEHIPKSLTLDDDISSAPKVFEIWVSERNFFLSK